MSQGDWTLGAVAFNGYAQCNQSNQNYAGYGPNISATFAQHIDQARTQAIQQAELQRIQDQLGGQKPMEGSKPIVVCGTVIENADDLDKAQRRAEELAHKLGCNAYILKPVRMVAPKRDVVTTELS